MATPPTPKARAYRDFLTPLLHRRFTDASLLVLGLCWAEATVLSPRSLLSAWFPVGMTGLRSLLLFIPCLAIFIIRLTDLHFGARTTLSDLQAVRQELVSTKALSVTLWHIFSALFFGEVYVWSKGQEANLGWVDYGRAYERPRLNENPMVLRCLYLTTAVVAAFAHLYWDQGRVCTRPEREVRVGTNSLIARCPTPIQDVISQLGAILRYTVNLTVAGLVTTLVLTYYLILRKLAREFSHFFGTMLNSQLPHKASFIGIIEPLGLAWQALTSTLLLTFLWSFTNVTFSAYVGQPPLKNEQPLTSEIRDNSGRIVSRSTDPNASLVVGMKSKKNVPHTFAFWELFLICTRFESRRKTIFLEADKSGNNVWSQIFQQCISEVEGVNTRITSYQTAMNSGPEAQNSDTAPTSRQPIQTLPRIANEQDNQGYVLQKPLPSLSHRVSDMAISAGSHPEAQSPLSPIATRAVSWSKEHLMPPEYQAQPGHGSIQKEVDTRLQELLRTPVGAPFRQRFEMTVKAVVFGTPYSAQDDITFAASSLAALLKASLTEDTCGVVAKDVRAIITTLTTTIGKVKQFVKTVQPHWTDVYFNDGHRNVQEVTDLIMELQAALETVLLAFSEYASSLNISRKELREAKEAAGSHDRQDMVKV